jgi:hypothetical protein
VLLTTRRCATRARVAATGQPQGADRGRPGGVARRAAVAAAPPPSSSTAPACGHGPPGRWSTGPPCRRCRATAQPRPVPGRRGRPVAGRAHRLGPGAGAVAAGDPRRGPPERRPGCWSAGRMPAASAPRTAFAALAGTNPIPASSGQVTRHRPRPGWRSPTQPRAAHHLAGAPAHRSGHPRLHGPPHRPGQEPPRRQAVPTARHRPAAVPAARTLRPTRRRNPPGSLTAHSSLTLVRAGRGPRRCRRVADRACWRPADG